MNQYNYDKGYLQRNRGEGLGETIFTFILAGIAFTIFCMIIYMLKK